jgi:uncharacterized protein
MIIDIHTHLGPTCPWHKKAEFNVTKKMFDNFLDLNEITKAVTFPNPQSGNVNYNKANKIISKAAKKDSRIIGFGRVDPREPNNALKELKKFKTLGLVGLKLHPVLECFNPDNDAFFSIYSFCEDKDLPIIFHCDTKNIFANPKLIESALKEFKKLKVILGHLAGQEAIDVVKQNKNFYLATSDAESEKMVEHAILELNAKRILFGSDFPYRDFSTELNRICTLNISKKAKENILYSNAKNLLQI